MMEERKRAWIYMRTNDDEHSPERLQDQKDWLERIADEKGYEIAGGSEDIASGNSSSNPGLDAMCAAAQAGEFDYLMVTSISRLGRNMLNVIELAQTLSEHNVDVFAADEYGFLEFSNLPRPFQQTYGSFEQAM